jgi:hypothetical protein
MSVTAIVEGVREVDKAVCAAKGEEPCCICWLGIVVSRTRGVKIASQDKVAHGAIPLDTRFKVVPDGVAVRRIIGGDVGHVNIDGMKHHAGWKNGLVSDAIALEMEFFNSWHGEGGAGLVYESHPFSCLCSAVG